MGLSKREIEDRNAQRRAARDPNCKTETHRVMKPTKHGMVPENRTIKRTTAEKGRLQWQGLRRNG